MPKTLIDIIGKGYVSLSPGHICPCCLSKNSSFSAGEMSWVCFECGEMFELSQCPSSRTSYNARHLSKPSSVEAVDMTKDFTDLRARLGK